VNDTGGGDQGEQNRPNQATTERDERTSSLQRDPLASSTRASYRYGDVAVFYRPTNGAE